MIVWTFAKIDSHQLQPRRGWPSGAPALDVNSATHRVDYAAEISQHPVAGVLDNSPAMFGHLVSTRRRR
jgi:hypothetical protein